MITIPVGCRSSKLISKHRKNGSDYLFRFAGRTRDSVSKAGSYMHSQVANDLPFNRMPIGFEPPYPSAGGKNILAMDRVGDVLCRPYNLLCFGHRFSCAMNDQQKLIGFQRSLVLDYAVFRGPDTG